MGYPFCVFFYDSWIGGGFLGYQYLKLRPFGPIPPTSFGRGPLPLTRRGWRRFLILITLLHAEHLQEVPFSADRGLFLALECLCLGEQEHG